MPTQVEPWLRIHEVFHPTDSSPGSEVAFSHALRLAAAAGAALTLMDLREDDPAATDNFSDVRGTLARWRKGGKDELIPEITVRWHTASGSDPVQSCLRSLERTPAELIVVATRHRNDRMTWAGESIAEPLARSVGEMTLLLPEGTSGFVRPNDGVVTLRNILVPAAAQPRPEPAIEATRRLMLYLPESGGTVTVLHVGDASGRPVLQFPQVPGWQWNSLVQSGDVVDAILDTAASVAADLVVMTTEGRHGFLDALRGTTTERVLRRANCPLLTMPLGSFLG